MPSFSLLPVFFHVLFDDSCCSYRMMLESWRADSHSRPTFASLERELRQLIEDLENAVDPEQTPASEIYVPAASQLYLEPVASSSGASLPDQGSQAPRVERMLSNDSGVASFSTSLPVEMEMSDLRVERKRARPYYNSVSSASDERSLRTVSENDEGVFEFENSQ